MSDFTITFKYTMDETQHDRVMALIGKETDDDGLIYFWAKLEHAMALRPVPGDVMDGANKFYLYYSDSTDTPIGTAIPGQNVSCNPVGDGYLRAMEHGEFVAEINIKDAARAYPDFNAWVSGLDPYDGGDGTFKLYAVLSGNAFDDAGDSLWNLEVVADDNALSFYDDPSSKAASGFALTFDGAVTA